MTAAESDSIGRIHDAPWLSITDLSIRERFLRHFGIDRSVPKAALVAAVGAAFAKMPFENLTKIIKAESVVGCASALRYPDELLGDFLRYGTGGTCFSLTASLVAILDSLGVECYPVLADRHYGPDTHSGVLLVEPGGRVLLLDPGYLLCTPVEVAATGMVSVRTPFNQVELVTVATGRVELWTVVKGNRKLRLTFRLEPVSDERYRDAWERSFGFEMMAYPVLTGCVNGTHQYLQGTKHAARNNERTVRRELDRQEQVRLITTTFGINEEIARRALEIVRYGANS